MSSNIDPHISAEEQEIARKREELAILQAELTDRELSLANLRAEIAAFEGRYLREVGVLYAELDDWNAKIAELVAEAAGTEQARAAASEARAQADESYAAAHGEAAKAAEYSPSPEIDKLYREVAKHIHPDLADDDADRALRTRLMAEANLARERRDADTLRKIFEEYKSSPESVRGDGTAADLQRVLRQIERISRKLAEIGAEVARLTSSEIAMLMAKVQTARSKGRDLLAEMRKDIQHKVDLASSEFETQCNERGRR
jgi:hypothetical protein